MIDFTDLDKTQLRYVEHDCPNPKITKTIIFYKAVNPLLNNVLKGVIANAIGISYESLAYMRDIDVLELQNIIKNYYGFSALRSLTQLNLLSFIKDNKFNTKRNRALLAEIFGDRVHEDSFMTDLQFVISKILYAILYV